MKGLPCHQLTSQSRCRCVTVIVTVIFSVLDESESKYNSLDEESSTSETARPTLLGDRPADREKDSDNSSTFSVESLDEDGE